MSTELQMLISLTGTIGLYLAVEKLYIKLGRSALVHPVLISIFGLMAILSLLGWQYEEYQRDTALIHFFLGPATVALAIPLYEQTELIKRMALPLLLSCAVGALVAAASATLLSAWWTGDALLSLSLAGKSVTTPIAMELSATMGGSTSLTAGIVLLTGGIGCLVIPILMRLYRIKDDATYGFIMGLTAHGFGTAQAFERSVTCGAFSGLAMSLTGVISAFLLPVSPLESWVELLVR